MTTTLDGYKKFIDDLVQIRPSVIARAIRQHGKLSGSLASESNGLLSELSPEQREVVAQLVQHGRDSGIHDTLVYLTDQVAVDGLRLVREGVELAVEPYGSEMYYDWVCRSAGDAWPEHQLEDQYKV